MSKKTVIMGVGNLLLCDEGIGVHASQEIAKWDLPEHVSVFDAGTLGLLSAPLFVNADTLIFIDSVEAQGEPGTVFRFSKEDIMLDRFPMKLSPHQIGVQDTLLISELRGECPSTIIFYGIIPSSYEANLELTPPCQKALAEVLEEIKKIIFE
ncbi:MAG: HyaD/HybD family hydrogenase maturation endopeptidase [Deferribacteraceae bacterium]|jgi:hydrogenase maturation protease|nr:HyaD/HybD family hydrogenase maturation endopeptidase [Deferribacteraceae bacterium]